MSTLPPILVTGAGGNVGSVGTKVVQLLRSRALPVRALVHHDDQRATPLRELGAEVVAGDLTRPEDILRVSAGCRRVFFAMSVGPQLLEATVAMAAVGRERGDWEVLVNMSQMTVSQMSIVKLTDSNQQRLHWLGEQALSWSGLPVVEVRPTIFLESLMFMGAESVARESVLRMPFGKGKTSPVAAKDVAAVVAEILSAPAAHIGKVYELTGPRTQDMQGVAAEFSAALQRDIRYIDAPYEQWYEALRASARLPAHVLQHVATMAKLHAQNRYDRLSGDVESVTGHPATSVTAFVKEHKDQFSPAAMH